MLRKWKPREGVTVSTFPIKRAFYANMCASVQNSSAKSLYTIAPSSSPIHVHNILYINACISPKAIHYFDSSKPTLSYCLTVTYSSRYSLIDPFIVLLIAAPFINLFLVGKKIEPCRRNSRVVFFMIVVSFSQTDGRGRPHAIHPVFIHHSL